MTADEPDEPMRAGSGGRAHVKTAIGEVDLQGSSPLMVIVVVVVLVLGGALGSLLYRDVQDRREYREDRIAWLQQLKAAEARIKEYGERQDMVINAQTQITRILGEMSTTQLEMAEWLWGNTALVEARKRREQLRR